MSLYALAVFTLIRALKPDMTRKFQCGYEHQNSSITWILNSIVVSRNGLMKHGHFQDLLIREGR